MSVRDELLAMTCGRESLDLTCGKRVWIQEKTAAEKTDFEKAALKISRDGKDREALMDSLRQRLVIWAVVDDEGKPIFRDSDAALIGRMPGKVVDEMVNAVRRLNEYTEKDIEALAKNDEETPGGDSPGVSA